MTVATSPVEVGLARGRSRSRLAVEVLACLAFVAVLVAPAFRYEIINRDEATIATIARATDAGRTLYEGIIDRKPPVVFELASLVGTDDLRPLRALALASLAATALITWRLALTWGMRSRWYQHVGVAFCALVLFPLEDGMSAGFELFALPALAMVLLGSVRGNGLAVGAFAALAVLTKQTALLPVAATMVVATRRHGSTFLGHAVLAGGAVGLVALSAYPPDELVRWVFLDDSGYLSGVTATSLIRDALPGLLQTVLAAAPIAALAWRGGFRRHPEAVAMAAGAVVSVVLGLRFAPHYALFLLVPLLPACVDAVFRPPRTRLHLGVAALVAVMSVVHHVPALNPSTEPFSDLTRAVRAVTSPTDEIFVWGQVSTVYWQTDRLPATSFPTTGFATGLGLARRSTGPLHRHLMTPSWDRLERELRRAAPPVLVDTSGSLGVPHPTILQSPLRPWVQEHYRPHRLLQGAVIWLRVW